jgi:hypothetical protein
MMQKRKSYLSLLLASFLLLFSYSLVTAQTISFENKDVPRCVTADMSIYVDNTAPLAAFEAIFEVGGDFTGFTVDVADLPFSTTLIIDGNKVRLAGYLGADPADACLPAGHNTVGTLHFTTADECEGAITVVSATVDDPFTHGSLFVSGCCGDELVQITPTFVSGLLTIVNQEPELTCPDDMTVHFGALVQFDVTGNDYDNCEELEYSLLKDPDGPTPAGVTINPTTGHVSWLTTGNDVCDNQIVVRLTDKCGAYVDCDVNVCVQNTPPEFTDVLNPGWMDNIIYTVWGAVLTQPVESSDPDSGPSAPHYTIVSFNGPTDFGNGLQIDPNTGVWTWELGYSLEYSGDFQICIKVDDGAAVCDPCSPDNSDEVCLDIHVTGYFVGIDKIMTSEASSGGVISGTNVSVPIRLRDDPSWKGEFDYQIGGFDFLISYDASALTLLKVSEGELIDGSGDSYFEYFTYRFVDNCGGSCPTGMVRIVGMRESNNGFTNPTHIYIPGELAVMDFRVTSDLTFECQFIPIRFFWIDCGDNTLSDETGEILYVAKDVYDFDMTLLTDPNEWGIHGPLNIPDGECYIEMVTIDPKNQPLAAILFQNGGIKITCINQIDDRGDVNLNGILYEVADAVVFTNYFIVGMNAFTISPAGQTAATDINADGTPLSVADLVYLIRIIVGDALPYAKLTPSDPIDIAFNGSVVDLRGTTDVGAALFVFDKEVIPTLADNASHMDIKYGYADGTTRVLIYSMEHNALSSGDILNIEGKANLIGVEASDNLGAPLEVAKTIVVPTEFALHQNYPNPFNPETVLGLALPVASNWNIAIFNVSGQKVQEFSGYSEAGEVQVVWDATNVASGMYFYKATTDQFSATKKMVLLK